MVGSGIKKKRKERGQRTGTTAEARARRTDKRSPTAKHPLHQKSAVTKPTKHIPKERTPEEFAKLSPAQQLYVKKGITASSEEGAVRMIEDFKRKTLDKQPAEQLGEETAAPIQDQAMEGGQSMLPEFDPTEKELNLYGSKTSQRIKQAITGAAIVGIVGLGLAGAAAVSGGAKIARGAAAKGADKLGSIENLKLMKNSMGSEIIKSAAGQIPAAAIRRQIKSVLARQIAVNTVNAAKTTNFLVKIYNSSAWRTAAVIGGGALALASVTLNILGTYPFAAFIPEESIQMLGIDSSRAIENAEWKIKKGEQVTPEELESIKKTLEFEREILSPNAQGNIVGSVPYKNVVDKLYQFYDGAALVNENKEVRFQKLLEHVEGEQEIDW